MKFIKLLILIMNFSSNPLSSFCICSKIQNKTPERETNFTKFILNLIRIKANLNANHEYKLKNKKYNCPPLALAVTFYNEESVKLLLENGAGPNIDYFEKVPVWDTENNCYKKINQSIFNYVRDLLPWPREEYESYRDLIQIAKLLIFAGVDISIQKRDSPILKKLLNEYNQELSLRAKQIDFLPTSLKDLIVEYAMLDLSRTNFEDSIPINLFEFK